MKGHRVVRTLKSDGSMVKDLDIATLVEGAEVIKNNIEERCSIFRGELAYDVTLGIPIKSGDKETMDLAVKNIINKTTGVREINKFSSTWQERKYKANIVVLTTLNTTINVEI